MKEYGLEREFFIIGLKPIGSTCDIIMEHWFDFWQRDELKNNILTAEETNLEYYACDECGYLAEARGKPANNIVDAFFNLKAAEHELVKGIELDDVSLVPCDWLKIPQKKLQLIRREYGKNASKNENMYGKIKMDNISRSGLHIHFSNIETVRTEGITHVDVKGFINMPRIIGHFDTYFKRHIKEAKRQEGAFEIKPHGFEYRSLPSSVGDRLDLLEDCVEKLEKRGW